MNNTLDHLKKLCENATSSLPNKSPTFNRGRAWRDSFDYKESLKITHNKCNQKIHDLQSKLVVYNAGLNIACERLRRLGTEDVLLTKIQALFEEEK